LAQRKVNESRAYARKEKRFEARKITEQLKGHREKESITVAIYLTNIFPAIREKEKAERNS
jgi:hypothetical protein